MATNYAMIDLWNIKLMDAFIFIAAFLFGVEVGLGSAVLTWVVYGFVNPYGQDNLVLLSFLITGESFFALAGALLSRTSLVRDLVRNTHRFRRACLILGIVGFQVTFGYDL
ncbi:hypothetical protein J2P12_04855, partial [Candidatus Bathyarchaeota archaeon]|nr:hypothetical protein [Candidatus Bathyarchaeota archaeon]